MSFSYTVRPADWKAKLLLIFEEINNGLDIDLLTGILSIGSSKGLGDIIAYKDYLKKTADYPIIIENISVTSDKLIRDIYGLEDVTIRVVYLPKSRSVIVTNIIGDNVNFSLVPDTKLIPIITQDAKEYEFIIPLQ